MSVPEIALPDEEFRPLGPDAYVVHEAETLSQQFVVPPDATPARMGLFGQLSGAFYPKFVFNGVAELNFEDPVNDLAIEAAEIGVQNLSLAGLIEGLSVRDDHRLTMTLQTMSYSIMDQVYLWWLNWARFSHPTAITLDRFATCVGQWEYDRYNTYFSRAVCLTRMKAPKRLTRGRQLFVCQLQFQQVPEDA